MYTLHTDQTDSYPDQCGNADKVSESEDHAMQFPIQLKCTCVSAVHKIIYFSYVLKLTKEYKNCEASAQYIVIIAPTLC